jgi:hypothetical protein
MIYCLLYIEGAEKTICEVEGNKCFETFRTHAEAQEAANKFNEGSTSGTYVAIPLPDHLEDGLVDHVPHGKTLADLLTDDEKACA